ncbi:MAG: hypothetical protein HND51_18335 [Chloroflexi bacterium]|nr:hypothetical protein [Chloroflexota bacterium]
MSTFHRYICVIGIALFSSIACSAPSTAEIPTNTSPPVQASDTPLPAATNTPEPTPTHTSIPTITNTPELTATFDPENPWSELTPLVEARSEMPVAVLDGRLYISGGLADRSISGVTSGYETLDSFEVYDPATNTWRTLPQLPEPRHHHMSVGYDGLIYVFGGLTAEIWTPSDNVWTFNPTTDTWAEKEPMLQASGAGAAVVLDEYIYIVGGEPDGQALLRYHPASDSWTELSKMSERREHTAAVALNGMIYVIGGRWQVSGGLSGFIDHISVEVYDPETDTWTSAASTNRPHTGHAAVVLDERIYVFGGEVLTLFSTSNVVEYYDPGTDIWTLSPPMPERLHGISAGVIGDIIYIPGGSTKVGDAINSNALWMYQPNN